MKVKQSRESNINMIEI